MNLGDFWNIFISIFFFFLCLYKLKGLMDNVMYSVNLFDQNKAVTSTLIKRHCHPSLI